MAFPTQSIGFVRASTQYATATDSVTLSVTGAFTIEGWYKFTTVPASNSAYSLSGKWVDTGSQDSYLLQLQNPAGVQSLRLLNTSTGANVGLATVASALTTATWYHIAAVYTTAPLFQYILNGVSQGTNAGTLNTSVFDGTGQYAIGTDNAAATTAVDGRMVLHRVWSTNRSVAQISANMCTTLGATASLSAEWTLDNVLTDNSGNGNTLTAVNTPTFTADVPATCSTPATAVVQTSTLLTTHVG